MDGADVGAWQQAQKGPSPRGHGSGDGSCSMTSDVFGDLRLLLMTPLMVSGALVMLILASICMVVLFNMFCVASDAEGFDGTGGNFAAKLRRLGLLASAVSNFCLTLPPGFGVGAAAATDPDRACGSGDVTSVACGGDASGKLKGLELHGDSMCSPASCFEPGDGELLTQWWYSG